MKGFPDRKQPDESGSSDGMILDNVQQAERAVLPDCDKAMFPIGTRPGGSAVTKDSAAPGLLGRPVNPQRVASQIIEDRLDVGEILARHPPQTNGFDCHSGSLDLS